VLELEYLTYLLIKTNLDWPSTKEKIEWETTWKPCCVLYNLVKSANIAETY